MKIGLLGGSFDPVHLGHIRIAQDAIASLHLDSFWFIPTKHNPWKENVTASNTDRINMLKLAISKQEKMQVSTIEINQDSNEKNYTIDTLHTLTSCYPDDQFYFLMGMDQACAFEKWKSAKDISKLVQLVAFNRGGYPEDHENLKKYHFLKMDNPAITASSTEIKDGAIQMLDPSVLHYISLHGLYLDSMIKNRMHKKRYLHSLSVAKLTAEFAKNNGLDERKGYIADVMHDVAKEMPIEKALKLMQEYYPEYIDKPKPIWHQWLSSYICEKEFLIDDKEILKAIEDHTTASTTISKLGKCLYCADKLDPLRGYDSSSDIALCNKDIDAGFRKSLQSFYDFSKANNREIDPVFFEIYHKFIGEMKWKN